MSTIILSNSQNFLCVCGKANNVPKMVFCKTFGSHSLQPLSSFSFYQWLKWPVRQVMDMLSVSSLIHHNTLIQNRPPFQCFEWFLRSTFPQDHSLTSNKGFHVYVSHANAGEAHCFKVLDNVYHFSICSSDLMRPSGKYLPKLPKSIKTETPHMYHMT